MTVNIAAVPVVALEWRPAHRIVPSRFPPVGPWDRIADPKDFDALAELDGLTNPRLRDGAGPLAQIPRERWVVGPGTTPIMAAFAHLNPEGSRFSDGTYGVFYASREIETAIWETKFHRERFLLRTEEPPQQIQMRCYSTAIQGDFRDIRRGYEGLHDPNDYSQSQDTARKLREIRANGIVYDSVRRSGGECVGVFWPNLVAPCTPTKHFSYSWNGRSIDTVIELTAIAI